MYGPAVRRKRFVDPVIGLASMYPASDWSGVLLRATMDISARSISLPDRPRRAIWVTSVRSRREDRSPSLRYLSQTSAGKLGSLRLHRAAPLPLPHFSGSTEAFPSSRPVRSRLHRAQGWSRLAVTLVSRLARRFQADLDEIEHVAGLTRVGAMSPSSSLRILVPWRALPRRYARACWRVRSPARCGAIASWRPRSTA